MLGGRCGERRRSRKRVEGRGERGEQIPERRTGEEAAVVEEEVVVVRQGILRLHTIQIPRRINLAVSPLPAAHNLREGGAQAFGQAWLAAQQEATWPVDVLHRHSGHRLDTTCTMMYSGLGWVAAGREEMTTEVKGRVQVGLIAHRAMDQLLCGDMITAGEAAFICADVVSASSNSPRSMIHYFPLFDVLPLHSILDTCFCSSPQYGL
jgi:hypothetical protein